MLEKVVTKLWQGRFVSVRDYEVERAIAKGGLIIHYDQKAMLVPRDQLQGFLEELPCETPTHKSKTGGKDYRLIDIPWKRKEPDTTNQEELFNV
jgi:hypothetical protein